MRATAILPVKRFGEAKQRLAAAGIEDARREALVAAMTADVLAAIAQARAVERTLVVSDEPAAAELAAAVGAEVIPDPGGGHSTAALAGIERAVELAAECAILLPLDCPLLDPRELDRVLTGVPSSYVAIVPDRHGTGTNALVLAPPGAIRPAFGEGSRERHVAAARAAGVPYAVEELRSLGLDLDTPADLVALTREIESRRGSAPRTARALGL